MASFLISCVFTVSTATWGAEPTVQTAHNIQVPTIAVVGIHHGALDPLAQRSGVDRLVVAIEASGRFDAVPTPEVRTGILGRESVVLEEGLLSGPREKLTLGRTAYNQASWDQAIVHLADAIAGFRAMFRGANNAEDLWDAYIYLGSSQLLRERPDEAAARAAFSAAVALSPAKPMNPALFPPNVVAVHEDVRTAVRATKVSVQVSAGPGSLVWLDGVLRGPAPLALPDVVAGEHHLVARSPTADGYLKFTAGGNPTLQIDLPMATPTFGTPASSPTGRSRQVAALYESLAARSVGLDYLLIAGTVDDKLYLQLFDTRTRTYSRPVEVGYTDDPIDEVLAWTPSLTDTIGDDGGFAEPAAAPPPLDVTTNCELALLLTERIAAEPFRGAPAFPNAVRRPVEDKKPPREREAGKGKTGTVVGVVLGVLATGGAAAGGYLFLSQQDSDPNRGVVVVQF